MAWTVPQVEKCCGCVTDLKTAAAIIAVLGIVTSPAVSWAVVRHSYVIRMSCFVTTSAHRADVVDINLNNILSFGFGANAGLGPSCLSPKNSTKPATFRASETEAGTNSRFVHSVRWVGWIVLIADIIFLGFSIYFLFRLFRVVYPSRWEPSPTTFADSRSPFKNSPAPTAKSSSADIIGPLPPRFADSTSNVGDSSSFAENLVMELIYPKKLEQNLLNSPQPPDKKAALRFMYSCIFAIAISFVYGMLYVAACVSVGGAFPVFEFMFCIVDVMIWSMWIYFMLVMRSYIREPKPIAQSAPKKTYWDYLQIFSPLYTLTDIWDMLNKFTSAYIGYIFSSKIFLFSWFSVWAYFLIVVNSYRQKS